MVGDNLLVIFMVRDIFLKSAGQSFLIFASQIDAFLVLGKWSLDTLKSKIKCMD